MVTEKRMLVPGQGGFIGHRLTKYLAEKRYSVRGVDTTPTYKR
jgi:nucleoside-diphosphate-sugar epimerase